MIERRDVKSSEEDGRLRNEMQKEEGSGGAGNLLMHYSVYTQTATSARSL